MLTPLRRGFDSRYAFLAYAALAGFAGFQILFTGIRGIPYEDPTLGPVPGGRASLVWMAGTVVMAMALAVAGYARVTDPDIRRRALYLLATGHLVVGLFVLFQWSQFWREHLSGAFVAVPLAGGAALLACALAASYARTRATPGGTPPIRSRYDEQIASALDAM